MLLLGPRIMHQCTDAMFSAIGKWTTPQVGPLEPRLGNSCIEQTTIAHHSRLSTLIRLDTLMFA